MSEHDFEPIRGLPGPLPEGESILWQGAPRWLTLAQQAFHIRAVAAYFAIMLIYRTVEALIGGQAPVTAVLSAVAVAPIALAAIGILAFMAWLNSRTTVYTITNRRVVMRFGAAIPKAINFPFTIIDGAALKPLAGGAGDLALKLKAPNKIAFLQLWPHVRPWKVGSPEPTLRGIADVRAVAGILASAMEAVAPIAVARPDRPIRAPQPAGRPETVAA